MINSSILCIHLPSYYHCLLHLVQHAGTENVDTPLDVSSSVQQSTLITTGPQLGMSPNSHTAAQQI